jgi:hypothetical protein
MQPMVHPSKSWFEFYWELKLSPSSNSGTWQGMTKKCLAIGLGLGMEIQEKEKQGKERKYKARHDKANQS